MHFQNIGSSRQEMFYKRAVMYLWLKSLKFTKIQLFTDIFPNFWPRVQNNYNGEQHFAVHVFATAPLHGCF